MIAPVDFGARARRPASTRSTTSPACCPEDGVALQRRPVGRLHRRPARGLPAHPRPPGQRRAVHHRRHPLRLGRRAAVRRLDVPGCGDSAGVEFVCSSVTSNNLKDITGTPPRTTSVAVEEAIIANNRHIKYLNFDRPRVLGARPDRRSARRWTGSSSATGPTGTPRSPGRCRSPPGRHRHAAEVDAGGDARRSSRQPVARPATAPDRPHGRRRPAWLFSTALGGRRRWPRRPRAQAGLRRWWSTAAGPTRSTSGLTPHLHGAARRRAALPAGRRRCR